MQQKNGSLSSLTQKITISAVFLSLALVTKLLFTVYIPLFGANGMKVGLAGIFTAFPAILFGPFYGGAVSALLDLLGTLIKPTGAYIPWFTLAAFLGGFLKGLIWKLIKEKNEKTLKVIVTVVLVAVGAFGVTNVFLLRADQVSASYFNALLAEDGSLTAVPDTNSLSFLSRLIVGRAASTSKPVENLDKYIICFTSALIVFAVAGLLVLLIGFFVSKYSKHESESRDTFKIFMALILSGLVVTTVNTELLRIFVYSSWQDVAFWILWIPRAIEEVVVCMVQACIVAVLYEVFLKKISPEYRLAHAKQSS